ncbi:MAG TPA: DUF4142 domain-containing protein [Nitrospiraceae bacterium]|nr:DUF4142 domain-containing protein [Nitrospiraceae bacterium]
MKRTVSVAGAFSILAISIAAYAANETAAPKEREFLLKAAQGQKAEIALGQLATEHAGSNKVKDFGRQMIDDHAKANEQVKQLASKEGVTLPKDVELPAAQQERAQRFQQLSGKEFDRAYMDYMLREHTKDIHEFEEGASRIKDPDVRQWASKTLPILKSHLTMARSIAEDLGIDMR